MIPKIRFVVDTNILLSQLLLPSSLPRKAFQKALSSGILLVSEDVLSELSDVLGRKKFDPYLSLEERQKFFRQLSLVVEVVNNVVPLKACRDPKDDKFLSLATSGQADFLLTGDKDLLVLDPFRKIRIFSCLAYLEKTEAL